MSSDTLLPRPSADAPREEHRAYAEARGLFWLPCSRCNQPFGGHEWLYGEEYKILYPPDGDGGQGVCPRCPRPPGSRETPATAARVLDSMQQCLALSSDDFNRGIWKRRIEAWKAAYPEVCQ